MKNVFFKDGGFDVFSDVSVLGECADFEFGSPQPFEGMMVLRHEGKLLKYFPSLLRNKAFIIKRIFYKLYLSGFIISGTDGYKGRYSKIYTTDNTDFKCYYVAFLDLEDSEAGQDCSIE